MPNLTEAKRSNQSQGYPAVTKEIIKIYKEQAIRHETCRQKEDAIKYI